MCKVFREVLAEGMWEIFQAVGAEVQIMRDNLSVIGTGTPRAYREAVRLVREFAHSF